MSAADEDRFTLEATALERLADSLPARTGSLTVRLIGPAPPAAAWGFPALVGGPVNLRAYPEGLDGFSQALEESLASSGAEVLIAADVREDAGSAPPGSPQDRHTEGSVALWVDDSSGRTPVGFGSSAGSSEGSTRAILPHLREWWSGLPPGARPAELGDWDGLLHLRTPEGPARPRPRETPGSVSQGAYLPRARYLEGLESAWRLMADRCGRCQRVSFPARARCVHCGERESVRRERLPRDGRTVCAVTWIGPGGQPTEFDAQVEASGGYGVTVLELGPGTFGTFQVADGSPSDLAIGSAADTRLRRLYYLDDEWRYGRKALPASTLPTRLNPGS